MKINVYNDMNSLIDNMVQRLIAYSHCQQATIHIALSGGNTPKRLFEAIKIADACYHIDWSRLHFWWIDERCVSYRHEESNYGTAKRYLFDHVNINLNHLHPFNVERPAEQSAIDYVQQMRQSIPLSQNGFPIFDWVWLGMGADGHVASIFPHGVSIDSLKWAEATYHPETNQSRVTLTLAVINQAKRIDMLVSGRAKAKMVQKILSNNVAVDYPARYVQPETGQCVWHLDQKAAGLISND